MLILISSLKEDMTYWKEDDGREVKEINGDIFWWSSIIKKS